MRTAGSPSAPADVRPLGLGAQRDGFLLVPATERGRTGFPLVVAFHGAGGRADQMIDLLAPQAARRGLLVLAPDARRTTWDVIAGGYGPDVAFLDAALDRVVADVAVDAARVAVAGFSDGASYALSLGIANGDLFTHVLAYSPGFAAPATSVGRPSLFISHGVADRVLPIDRCTRRLVPLLQDDGYEVTYEEFAGGHTVPPEILDRSLTWLTR